MQNYIITDSLNPLFQRAFKSYFGELGISIRDWDGLFREMNEDAGNVTVMRLCEQGRAIGFIQLKIDTLYHWFFEERVGFIRELWISAEFRNLGYGTALLRKAEDYLVAQATYKAILTTDTAPDFYLKNGYTRNLSYKAKNHDDVFTKLLQ